MKKESLKKALLITCISFLIINCSTQNEFDELNSTEIASFEKEIIPLKTILFQYSNDLPLDSVDGTTKGFYELLVKYKSHITTEKQRQEVRNRHDVVDFESCQCRENKEIWRFRILSSHATKDKKDEADADDDVDEVDENH